MISSRASARVRRFQGVVESLHNVQVQSALTLAPVKNRAKTLKATLSSVDVPQLVG